MLSHEPPAIINTSCMILNQLPFLWAAGSPKLRASARGQKTPRLLSMIEECFTMGLGEAKAGPSTLMLPRKFDACKSYIEPWPSALFSKLDGIFGLATNLFFFFSGLHFAFIHFHPLSLHLTPTCFLHSSLHTHLFHSLFALVVQYIHSLIIFLFHLHSFGTDSPQVVNRSFFQTLKLFLSPFPLNLQPTNHLSVANIAPPTLPRNT